MAGLEAAGDELEFGFESESRGSCFTFSKFPLEFSSEFTIGENLEARSTSAVSDGKISCGGGQGGKGTPESDIVRLAAATEAALSGE